MDRNASFDATDMEIIASLKARRERMGLTQSQVSAAMNEMGLKLDQSGLSRVEKGKRALTVGEAAAYARALSTTLEEALRNDPLDMLIADTRAKLRALENSRANAVAALGTYSSQMERLSEALDVALEFIDAHSGNASLQARIEASLIPVLKDSYPLVSGDAEDRIAAALDELEQTTTHSAALRHSRGESV